MATALNTQYSVPTSTTYSQARASYVDNLTNTEQVNPYNIMPDWLLVAQHLPDVDISPQQRLSYLKAIRVSIFSPNEIINNNNKQSLLTTKAQQLKLACQLAEYLADGILLCQLLEQRISILTHTENSLNNDQKIIALKIQLAENLAKMGQLEQAIALIEQTLLAHPFDAQLLRVANLIQQHWRQIPYHLAYCRQQALMLMPLTSDYVSDFYWQYGPRVQQLCNLPQFESDTQWLQWLTNEYRPNQQIFAVIHQHWGFIGSVSIEIYQGIGYFYYWLGDDFQGQGFGPQAVDLLLTLAVNYHNMDCCYAKVYQHNKPSQKAMEKLGFSALTITAQSPYDNEVYYYCGPKKHHWQLYQELDWLLQMQYSDERLIAPLECIYQEQ